ncbi:cytosolic phospholipase A2 zeta-like isoform X1 [Pelodiscus sinensis]|uniref:cytosolic phospholipase A2 zeta-like isoform X1 n=2 Tax=Pelodiscus sinensis TaxID=13735 RepID=UPI003F6C79E4
MSFIPQVFLHVTCDVTCDIRSLESNVQWKFQKAPLESINQSVLASVRGTGIPGLGGAWTQSLMFRAVLLNRMSTQMLPLLAAVVFKKKDTEFSDRKHEKHPYYNLTVKVLRARNIRATDLLSKADCYVALDLPTASPVTSRTQVVYNSNDPEWNETFKYRIHSIVKNILEFTFYDKDIVLRSRIAAIDFDVGNINPGQTLNHTFVLNPKEKEGKEELDVEFSLEESTVPPTEAITNGVLVAHPCLRVQGSINKSEKTKWIIQENCQVKLSVPGAFENRSSTFCSADSEERRKIPFLFHVDREILPELHLELLQTTTVLEEGWSEDLKMHTARLGVGSVPLTTLPLGQELEISVPLGKGQGVDLTVKVEESPQELDVRISFDLCKGEREFLDMRKKIVSQAVKKTLGLPEEPKKDEIPIVAVVGSGGGMRAMTAFYGNLSGLQQLDLLDILMYMGGLSGSTWCLSKLYKDPHWSHKDLQDAISVVRNLVTSSKVGAFSAERLVYYFQQLLLMEKEGWKVTLTDLWGLIIEYFLCQQQDPSKLSDQQSAVRWGQNPFPIYAAVSVKPNVGSHDFTEWCEFTPYEFGIYKYGAFIRIEDFGSEFFNGMLLGKRLEPRISFLQGIWASAFAANLDEIWEEVISSKVGFLESLKDAIKAIDEARGRQPLDPLQLERRMVMPGGAFSHLFQDLFKSRFSAEESTNFMRGLYLHKDYASAKEFVAWKGTHQDAFPNKLTPMERKLYLVDGVFSINSPFPLVLHPERDVDVILSFNYSWEAPFEVLHQAQKYCEEREIPFPHIVVSETDKQQPKECYMFVDVLNPKAPIVLHFPLVNNTFQKFKAPRVERETEDEKAFGNFSVEEENSPYHSMNFTYQPNEFDRLLELSRYNIMNNKDAILKALTLGMKRRVLKMAKKT